MATIQNELNSCVSSLDWVKTARFADIPGEPAILVDTLYRPDGRELSYYIRYDGAEGIGSAFSILEGALCNPSNPTADKVDRVLAELAALNGIEDLRFEALSYNKPVARFALPGIGAMNLEITAYTDVRKSIRGERSAAQARSGKRHLSIMSLFGIATVAADAHDARVLVETVMSSRDYVSLYRGIASGTTPSDSRIRTKVMHGALMMDQDRMTLHGVPDTLGTALCGRGSRGRPLSSIVGHPVMNLLRVKTAEWDGENVVITPSAWMGRSMGTALAPGAAKDLVERIVEASRVATT